MAQKSTAIAASRRSESAALRRSAIVDAALDEFVERGFAATRMEDIARRAGVAKGTIYLNFSDKEALFEAIVKQEIRPNVDVAASLAASGGSLRDVLRATLLPLVADLTRTRRGAVLRMLIGEAHRFPKLAEVYFRLVVQPGMASMRVLVQRAMERGELRDSVFLEYPQLLLAPVLLSVVWLGLFERFHHLDTDRMVHTFYNHLVGSLETNSAEASNPCRKTTSKAPRPKQIAKRKTRSGAVGRDK